MNKVPVEKNKEYIVEILDNGYEGEGIAKIDDFAIFIPNGIKGEKVKVLILKVLSSYAYGKIVEIIKKSPHRTEVDCPTYKRCGGCDLRHINYEETLNIKQNAVQNLVNKNLKTKIKVEPTWGMGNPYNYRNKLQFPVGVDKEGNPTIGVYANRTHEIIPVEECMIQDIQATNIAKDIVKLLKKYKISAYDESNQNGLVRHIVIKTGFRSREVMVIFVINGKELPCSDEIVKELTEKYSEIKSIVLNINMKNTNVILGEKNINILGEGVIFDYLGDYKFKISPLSFYQVNPIQAEAMYNYAVEEAKITKEDIVFDLYCGIGTISLFMARHAKKVYGVEIVEQAIQMAKENALNNKVQNTEFIAGDTELVLTDLIENKKIIPDIIMVDPPRKGLDNTTISNILKIKPRKVIYISCNPASFVRDLAKLEEEYEIKSIQPFDMFPFTHHVECVSVLELKESTEK